MHEQYLYSCLYRIVEDLILVCINWLNTIVAKTICHLFYVFSWQGRGYGEVKQRGGVSPLNPHLPYYTNNDTQAKLSRFWTSTSTRAQKTVSWSTESTRPSGYAPMTCSFTLLTLRWIYQFASIAFLHILTIFICRVVICYWPHLGTRLPRCSTVQWPRIFAAILKY